MTGSKAVVPRVHRSSKRGPIHTFIRHGALVFGAMILANVLTYVSYAGIARAMGVEATGLFTALVSAALFLSLPSSVGATVVARAAAAAAEHGDDGINRFLGLATSAIVIPVLFIALVAATLGNAAIAAFFHVSDPMVVVLFAVVLVFTFPLSLQRAVMQGASRFRAFSFSNVLEGAGKAATGIALFARGGHLRVALGSYAITEFATFAWNAVILARSRVPIVIPRPQPTEVVRHLVGIALPIAALTAMTFTDTILVRHYLRAQDAGLYGASALVGRALITVVQFVPTVLLPRATAAVVGGRSPVPFLLAASSAAVVVIGCALCAVGTAPQLAVTLIAGKSFAAAAPLVLPYAGAMAGLALASVFASYLIGIGRYRFAVPILAVALLEVVAIVLIHSDAGTVVRVVLVGHLAALACCCPETLLSVWGPADRYKATEPKGLGRSTEEVTGS